MSNATTATTIRPEEAAHFGKLAADWWDPKGSSAMLHRLNPVRIGYVRDRVAAHWQRDALTPTRAVLRCAPQRPLSTHRGRDREGEEEGEEEDDKPKSKKTEKN